MSHQQPNSGCPPETELKQFIGGFIDDEARISAISSHLESCDTCLNVLSCLEQSPGPGFGTIQALAKQLAIPSYQDSEDKPSKDGKDSFAQAVLKRTIRIASSRSRRAPSGDSLNEFLEAMVASGLYSRSEVRQMLMNVVIDNKVTYGEQVSRILLARGILTPFQIKEIERGGKDSLVLGDYRLLETMEVGGGGRVLKAEHRRLKRRVIIRELSQTLRSEFGTFERFRGEVEAVSKRSCPDPVQLLEALAVGDQWYLVTEFIEGEEWSAVSETTANIEIKDIEALPEVQIARRKSSHFPKGTVAAGASLDTRAPQSAADESGKTSRSILAMLRDRFWNRKLLLAMAAAGLTFLVYFVFIAPEPEGALRVLVLEPDVEVSILGNDVMFTGTDSPLATMPPGEKRLLVTGNGFSFEPRPFDLRKGMESLIKVERVGEKMLVTCDGEIIGEQGLSQKILVPEEGFGLEMFPASYIEIPSLRRNNSDPFTVEMWLQSPERRGILLNLEGTAPLQIGVSPSGISVKKREPTADFEDDVLVRWQPHLQHLALVIENQSYSLYLDGKKILEGKDDFHGDDPKMVQNASVTMLGSQLFNSNKGYHWCGGLIHQVRMSKSARYHDLFRAPLRFDTDSETLALYRFDEGLGETLKDSSGHGHHGRIVGARWLRLKAR